MLVGTGQHRLFSYTGASSGYPAMSQQADTTRHPTTIALQRSRFILPVLVAVTSHHL